MAQEPWRWTGTDRDVARAVEQLEQHLMKEAPRLYTRLTSFRPSLLRMPLCLYSLKRMCRLSNLKKVLRQIGAVLNEVFCLPGIPRRSRPRP
jgi:hypothetical protein